MAANIEHFVSRMIMENRSIRCFLKSASFGGIPTESRTALELEIRKWITTMRS